MKRLLSVAGASLVGFLACSDDTSTPPAVTPTNDGGTTPSVCPTPTGAGTDHTSLTGNETWTAATGPHRMTTNLAIAAGATLTIEPCAVVELGEAAGFLVEGTLDARGQDGKPITLRASEAGKRWRKIETRKTGKVNLHYATLENGGALGGDRPTQAGLLDVRGDQDAPAQELLDAQHVTIRGSEAPAIWMREGGGLAATSTDITITGGASFPMHVWGSALRTLPATMKLAGNANDALLVPGLTNRDQISQDATIRKYDVPYQIGSSEGGGVLRVQADASAPLLTIEAGVEMRFIKGGGLVVSSGTEDAPARGALLAKGTAEAPIVFTSAEAAPAPGDWMGIWLGGKADARTTIDHAVIRFAGGRSGANSFGCPSPATTSFANEGAILILGGDPGRVFVTNTTIENSAGEGIVRGWTGANLDFQPTNTFTSVTRCNQTLPKPVDDVCPSPAPCPK